jgi:hypothetical protein
MAQQARRVTVRVFSPENEKTFKPMTKANPRLRRTKASAFPESADAAISKSLFASFSSEKEEP